MIWNELSKGKTGILFMIRRQFANFDEDSEISRYNNRMAVRRTLKDWIGLTKSCSGNFSGINGAENFE